MGTNARLYDTDFYAWVQDQAALLAARRFEDLDLPHLVEELQLMGSSERGELANRLSVLLAHLLKLQVTAERLPYVYARAQRGWHLTCTEQRLQLKRLLRRNPSLGPTVSDELPDAYAIARLQAAIALGVDETSLPLTCAWTPEAVLETDFWPTGEPGP
jgi:Domain of unknown function DUF29